MNKSYTKYKIQFKAKDETVKKALELAIKKEYEMRKEANEIKRCIMGLFDGVDVEILSISRYTKVRKLK